MQFCPKCKSVMVPMGSEEFQCSLCGHMERAKPGKEAKREVEEGIPVIEEEAPPTLPATDKVKCPNCGHNQANWWIRQTRSADEPSTRFYRCVKCKRVWREYA